MAANTAAPINWSDSESEAAIDWSDSESDSEQAGLKWETASEWAAEELDLFTAHLERDNQMVEDLAAAIDILVAKAPEWDPSPAQIVELAQADGLAYIYPKTNNAVAMGKPHPTCPNEACDLIEFLLGSVQTHVLEKLILKAQQWGIKWANFLIYTFNFRKRKHRHLLDNPKKAHNHLKRIYKANKRKPQQPQQQPQQPAKRARRIIVV